MACPRAYSHHIRYPSCGSNRMPKCGISKGRHPIENQALRRLRTLPHSRCRLHSAQRRRPGTRPGPVRGWRFVEFYCAHLWRHSAGGEPVGQKRGAPRCPGCAGGASSTADPAGRQPAAVIAYAEMWTYQQARHGDKRQDLWLWTAVVAEPDGRRGVDSEVGDRSENIFQKLYSRLPEAELHRSDAYGVYQSWLLPSRHVAGKGGAVNWNEGIDWHCYRRGCGAS